MTIYTLITPHPLGSPRDPGGGGRLAVFISRARFLGRRSLRIDTARFIFASRTDPPPITDPLTERMPAKGKRECTRYLSPRTRSVLSARAARRANRARPSACPAFRLSALVAPGSTVCRVNATVGRMAVDRRDDP